MRAPLRPLAAAVALCALAPWACAHERLVWRLPDGSDDRDRRAEDVYACEAYTAIVDDDRRFVTAAGPRAYGGWGNFTFERCMSERGWILTRVPGS